MQNERDRPLECLDPAMPALFVSIREGESECYRTSFFLLKPGPEGNVNKLREDCSIRGTGSQSQLPQLAGKATQFSRSQHADRPRLSKDRQHASIIPAHQSIGNGMLARPARYLLIDFSP